MSEVTENKETNLVRPNDRFTVIVGSEAKSIFMSAGLLRRIAGIAQFGGDVSEIYTNPYLQSSILVELLTPKEIQGEARDKVVLEDYDISTEEADKLLAFATEHVLYFFVSTLTRLKQDLSPDNVMFKLMTQLVASQTGLKASLEKKLSAGDSTAS